MATQREKLLRLRNFANFVKSASQLSSVVMKQLARPPLHPLLARQKTAKNRNTAGKIVRLRNFANFVRSASQLAFVVMKQFARQKTAKDRNTAQKIVEANEKSLKALNF